MSDEQQVYVGDSGFDIPFISGIDLTNAVDIVARITHETDTAIDITRTIVSAKINDLVTGDVNIPIQDGDLVASGDYIVMLGARQPGTFDLASHAATFFVAERKPSNFWNE